MLKNKKVLVTGACGFIGSHLVEKLCQLGCEVTALVQYNSHNDIGNLKHVSDKVIQQISIIKGDIRDAFMMKSLTKGMDYVFHLAALIGIPYSYSAPSSYIDTNIVGTLNILEACKENSVTRMIHTSTSEVYGTAQYTPIDEQHPLQGQSPYSATKISADKMAESYYCSFGLPVVTVRPFNTYGPRQSERAIIPTIISQALFRSSIHLGALHPTRDLTYVDDTVAGFIAAAIADGIEGEVMNLGTGKSISIEALVFKVLSILNIEKEIVCDQQRFRPNKSEVGCLLSNNEKAKNRMGWEPNVTLSEGLSRVIDFVKSSREILTPEQYVV